MNTFFKQFTGEERFSKPAIAFYLLKVVVFPIQLMPYSMIHGLGRVLGSFVFWIYPTYRKKALTNLAIAFGDSKSEKERKVIARRSFQNVMITCLEFFKLKKKDLKKLLSMREPEKVTNLQEKGQSIVFLSGHQANWEIPFLALNHLSPGGVAVGRPIKNPYLYKWIIGVREMNGGKIVMPRSAMKAGLKALKQGKYIGIVGDQAFPESDYSYPLLGTRTWLSTAPAILAYKTKSPLIVGINRRIKGGYEVSGSPPIWPDYSKPMKEAIADLMDRAFAHFEESIKGSPDQWMWIHDRWKQQTIDHVKREYRHGFILALLPKDDASLKEKIQAIYPRSFVTFMTPDDPKLFDRDYRYGLVLDFANLPKVRRHYKKLGAVKALSLTPETMLDQLVKQECQSSLKTTAAVAF